MLDENNEYICLLAQCTNIIRAGIKKYARLRTSITSKLCSKSKLNNDNHKKYNCNLPIGPYDQCPSFTYLHNKQGKTCKHILKSSELPNKLVSFIARAIPSCGKKNVRNITFRRNRTRTRRRRNTRSIIRENINILNNNNNNNHIINVSNNNAPYKSVHIVNSKNIPDTLNE